MEYRFCHLHNFPLFGQVCYKSIVVCLNSFGLRNQYYLPFTDVPLFISSIATKNVNELIGQHWQQQLVEEFSAFQDFAFQLG